MGQQLSSLQPAVNKMDAAKNSSRQPEKVQITPKWSVKRKSWNNFEKVICCSWMHRLELLRQAQEKDVILIVAEEWKQKAGRFLRSLPQG